MSTDHSYIAAIAEIIRSETAGSGDLDPGLYLLYALLVCVKGDAVSAADVHDAWTTHYEQHGAHRADMVPFDALSPQQQALDEPWAATLRSVALRVGATAHHDDPTGPKSL